MRTNRHKVTLVGLGAMGQRHARVLLGLPERFELAGAYDPRKDAVAPPGLTRLASEAEAIAAGDVLVIASPIAAHAPMAMRALAAGRSVFVEKPLCATGAEAEAILVAAGRSRHRLLVGHSERFNPVVRVVSRLLRGEAVAAFDFERAGPSRPSECGVLLNLGVHDLDLARYLAGGEVALRGAVGGPDFAEVLLSTAGGAVGRVHVDRTAPHRRRSITLTTTAWTYEGDLLSHRLVRTARDTGVRSEVPLPLEEPLVAQARALADVLDGAVQREIATGVDGAAAVVIAERAAEACAVDGEGMPLSERRGTTV